MSSPSALKLGTLLSTLLIGISSLGLEKQIWNTGSSFTLRGEEI